MNHIGLVALKGQIMRFIVQPILLQEYRRWDIYNSYSTVARQRKPPMSSGYALGLTAIIPWPRAIL